ncbi:hypothetical protein RDV64_12885 [Acuticoccus sp. MNP-M23]|uniref:hypothetical protein n=1 Tax=Acuticoccus sp. MNP-M23 TaxID=3072793 RepID=UPI0028149F12|nr:hypothetical protein [Acuticoccus sp. MNP-M23]WMS40983.1 hypothetical protein RDV64_12885 [Acuticoccus sp. MNP-M23]
MTSDRRLLTPISATIVAGAIVGIATLGGTMAGNQASATKADRFAMVGEELCEGQSWPNLTPACLNWSEGVESGPVRFVTLTDTDGAAGQTNLVRVRDIVTN